MRIFTKTFLYTLGLLTLIALLANGLVYTLLPGMYTKQRQSDLTEQTDRFVKQLEGAKRGDIVSLMSQYADSLQANLILKVGDDNYSMLTWSGGVITENDTAYAGENAEYTAGDDRFYSGQYAASVIVTGDGGSQVIGKPDGVFPAILSALPGTRTIETTRTFFMEGEPGSLTAILTLAPVDEAVGVIISLLPVSILLCVVIAVVFSLLYARAITRPIQAISGVTRRMTALERGARCEIKTRDEFGELAANVNGLYDNLLRTIGNLETELRKVAEAEQAKTSFLRAASHELKTPVTAISVIMENMILGVGKYKNRDEWIIKCKELVDSLSAMLHDILDASRLEDAAEEHVTQSVEQLCAAVLDPHILIARAKGLSVYIDWSASFMVTAPPTLLGKALSSIFSNAVQYTATGGRLAIYCRERALIVENECEPVSGDQLPRLYEPFYQPGESRGGGNGLGLYIADAILRLLGLAYRFEPMASPDGMRFTIFF